jgi:hypothetical protein
VIRRIVSGGQSGADRAALDVAAELGLERGGWVPKGRLAEDGVIPALYENLVEASSDDPCVRTRLNARDSDATLLLTRGEPTGGSAFTAEVAQRLRRPLLHLDLAEMSVDEAVERTLAWFDEIDPTTLNVAGPRASKDPKIYGLTVAVLGKALRRWFRRHSSD